MLEKILDYARMSLYAVILVLGFLLFQAWQKDYPSEAATSQSSSEASNAKTETPALPAGRFVPQAVNEVANPAVAAAQQMSAKQTGPSVVSTAATGKLVTVTTDLLQVTIDARGGDIVGVKLLNYPESLGSKTPFVLLNDEQNSRYIAESGLLSKSGPDLASGQAQYTTTQTSYTLNPQDQTLTVKLDWQNEHRVKVSKLFTFTRNSYEIKVGYDIDNQSKAPWEGNFYTQLIRANNPPPNNGGVVSLATYFGAAISTPAKPFQKITFKEMQENALNQTVKGGWVAMIQHYFISAWVPSSSAVSHAYSNMMPNGLYAIGMMSEPLVVPPGAKLSTGAKLYTGPAIADLLEKTSPNLNLTIDYGWFWFISGIIFWMMQKIYNVVGNWGWSIVLVTIVIKLMFYHLSAKSYRSMSGLKKLQPKIEALKQRFGDDKQKMTQATLELYKQEKVNPMSGCLPMLVQIPVFIALYWVLVESVELRQAPFILWIHDLSQQDPYYILPVLMGLSMFIQQRLNPPPADPLQAKVMMLMPVVFTALFAKFPAGLMLYWFVNNTLSFLQQWYIMHKLEKETNGKRK